MFAPVADFEAYYKAHDETPVDFITRLTELREQKKLVEVEKALKAYMRYRPKHVNSTMYELLAVAVEVNHRGKEAEKAAAEARDALGWAAYLSLRGNDPLSMTHVADMLAVRRLDEVAVKDARGVERKTTIAQLLDAAALKAPSRPEPTLMAIELATRKKDPERLIAAVARLMTLGWPNTDELWRVDARRRVEAMAKELVEQGKAAEAKSLLERLAAAEARDLVIRLRWKGDAAVGLKVEEPLGATADHFMPRTVFGGSIVAEGRGKDKESAYTCPLAFDGEYKVRIEVLYVDPKIPVREATLEIITHEGTPQEVRDVRTVSLDKPRPEAVTLSGGRRRDVLPYVAPQKLEIRKGAAPKP